MDTNGQWFVIKASEYMIQTDSLFNPTLNSKKKHSIKRTYYAWTKELNTILVCKLRERQ